MVHRIPRFCAPFVVGSRTIDRCRLERHVAAASSRNGLGERWPGRRRNFRSAASAQFWFEWKRGGYVLPTFVAALLGLVMVPSSWNNRADPSSTFFIY